jgi:hypothetical protein
VRWWAFCWVMGWVPLYDPNVLFCTSAYYSLWFLRCIVFVMHLDIYHANWLVIQW